MCHSTNTHTNKQMLKRKKNLKNYIHTFFFSHSHIPHVDILVKNGLVMKEVLLMFTTYQLCSPQHNYTLCLLSKKLSNGNFVACIYVWYPYAFSHVYRHICVFRRIILHHVRWEVVKEKIWTSALGLLHDEV